MRLIAWLLLFQFGFQSLGTLKVYLAFELNHDYIAEALCIQKDVENNDCQGNCYLMKSLDENKEREAQLPSTRPEESLFVFGISIPTSDDLKAEVNEKLNACLLGQHEYSLRAGISPGIFHPPTQA